MKTTTPASTARRVQSPLVSDLNLTLADSYALMALTHSAHWNVEGPNFFDLHKAFQEHYENLFLAIDDIAERIRALDAYAIGGLRALAHAAGIDEFKAPLASKDYVAALAVAHEKTIGDLVTLRDRAGEANDLETQDLAIGRITWHQKTLWMMKSFLK